MKKATIPVLLLMLTAAAPLRGQVVTPADTAAAPPVDTLAVPAPPDTAAVEAPAPADTATPEADAAPPAAEEPQATHDWEFALTAAEAAPGAGGTVLVTEGEGDNAFAVAVRGLPQVDALDQEGRDVAEYGVWIVPSKERVSEATRVGTLTVDAEGTGRFEGSTALDTFGIIVLAQAAGATGLSGVAVLTGIPVTQAAPAEEPADETPDDVAPETPDDAAPETPDEPAAEPPSEDPAPEPPAEEPAPQAPGAR
jgi:hypothetical protein